jgi:predicted nuclease with TOPRIM domain
MNETFQQSKDVQLNNIQSKLREEHSRLNEKQKQLEDSIELQMENYKSKIVCVQCGKEALKIKCKDCSKETLKERISYNVYISSWAISTIIVFFISDAAPAVATGLCCGSLFVNLYKSF